MAASMGMLPPEPPASSYTGARYFREFIANIRRDQDAGKFEHLEDYPYDIYVDDDLGLRLYHAGINPYDHEHFRHQIYLVVTDSPHGKASKLRPADTVVAASLTLQWTKRGDLCNALLLSIKSFGQCTFAFCGDSPSRSKCGWCGHNQMTLLLRNHQWRWTTYRRGRVLRAGERHCCKWNPLAQRYQCCRCKNPENALMSSLDREEAASKPQSVLPATLEGHKRNMTKPQNALVRADLATPNPAPVGVPPRVTVNNFNFYGEVPPAAAAAAAATGGPMSLGPWGYMFSAAMPPMVQHMPPKTMIGFGNTAPAPEPHALRPAGHVEEIEDNPPQASSQEKPRKYFRPQVEDSTEDDDDATRGLAQRFARTEVGRGRIPRLDI